VTRQEQIQRTIAGGLARRSSLRFSDLFDLVQVRLPDVTATELDAAARPYESGEPGAHVYRLPEESAQLALW
jgi:hypothetical protein